MKLNLKSTIAAPADHNSCQGALNGIIGNTRRGIVVDKTLDTDSNNPVANKPVSTALAALAGQLAKGQVVFLDQLPESGEPHKVYVLTATNQRYWWDGNAFVKIVPTDIKDSATIKHTLAENKISLDLDETIKGKINAALQKPAGLTKTKLVGVGTNGQENIEIGDNLTLANGKLSANGGGDSIPVVEGTLGEATGEGDIATITIPNAQTDNFILHITNQNVYMQHFGRGFCGSIPVDNISTYIYRIYDTFGFIYSSSYIEHIEIMGNVDPITFTSAGYFSKGTKDILYSKINEKLVTPLYPSLEDTKKYTYYYTDENKMLQEKQVQLEETQTATLFNKYKIKIPKGVEYSDMILPFTTLDNEDDGKVLTIVNKQVQWATPTGSIPQLPADASNSTYVLKAVNGTVQWVKES